MALPRKAFKATVETIGPPAPRLIVRIGGLGKRGKTHWALTAPGPLAFFDMNDRTEMVVDKFMSDKDVWMLRYRVNRQAEHADWKAQWASFRADWATVCKGDETRTLVLDTDTDLWELRRIAEFGRDSSIPEKYAPLNRDMRQLFELVNASGKNLVVVSEMKKQYVDWKDADGKRSSGWNGEYEMAGWSGVDFKVQVNLEARYDFDTREFGTWVINSGINPAINHEEYWGDMSCFPYLATEAYPDTEMEYWL